MTDLPVDKAFKPIMLHTDNITPLVRPYGCIIEFGLAGQHLENFRVARVVFEPGTETRGHYHLTSEEAYIVENGSATMKMWHYLHPADAVSYQLSAGDYLSVPRQYVHHVGVICPTHPNGIVGHSPLRWSRKTLVFRQIETGLHRATHFLWFVREENHENY